MKAKREILAIVINLLPACHEKAVKVGENPAIVRPGQPVAGGERSDRITIL
jgi:hypothetical protein